MHRIISLLPGATEIVAALGALHELVGISHECDFPAAVQALPRVTTSAVDAHDESRRIDDEVRRLASGGAPLFAVDAAQVTTLAPTILLTQALCEVCAVSDGDVRALTGLLDPPPRIISMSGSTLDGVWADIRAVGDALGREAEAEQLLGDIATRMRRVHETLKAARAPRPRVAVIEWLDPVYAAGHWTPELVRRAGGIDVLAEPGAHSVVTSVDRVRDAAPEIVLFAPCGFDVERAAHEATALLGRDDWRWAAGLQAWAIDGNALTSRPGPRLASAVDTMAAIFNPTLFPPTEARYARRLTT